MGIALRGKLPGSLQVVERSGIIPAVFEMDGELSCNFIGTFCIALFHALPNEAVQADSACCTDPFINHLLIDDMAKPILAADRAVSPFCDTYFLQKQPLPRQVLTGVFNVI